MTKFELVSAVALELTSHLETMFPGKGFNVKGDKDTVVVKISGATEEEADDIVEYIYDITEERRDQLQFNIEVVAVC